MAWGENGVEFKRNLFCRSILDGELKMSVACRQFQISRPTGYEWLSRYEKEGSAGLVNRSSSRLTQSNKTPAELEDCIILTKLEYKYFGPDKIYIKLKERYPGIEWPQTTTIHNILKKNGLVQPRRLRRLLATVNKNLQPSEKPNDVWCMDFKGWYMTSDQIRYDPFTLTDHESRYLIRCNKLKSNNTEHVWAVLETAFREYGLPNFIRSDNGPPFATCCPGRLSKLSIKFIKAGITHQFIEPGNPQENGRHERMHLTMKQEGFVLGSSLKEQMDNMEEFIEYYNFERPHEALNQKTPGSIYVPSSRIWTGKFNSIEYSSEYKAILVRCCGNISWKSAQVYVSRVLEGERVGVKETERGFEMYYANVFLGIITKDLKLDVVRRKTRIKKPFLIKEDNVE